MIAGVRQFKLINGNGTEYDMTRPDALLHAPDGLGWGTEATVNRLGMTYIGINEKEIHQSPSGEMVFRTYEEYGRFLSFCQQGGLVLCYKPIDTWYYCECLISIQKSEIQWENNHLICPVQFTLLSYWYEKVVAQTAEPPEPVEPNYRTVTGDPAVFNARYSYPIKDLSVAIQGSQELNGYDKPWVGGRGKNKFNGTLYNGQVGSTGTWSASTTRLSNANGTSDYSLPIKAGTYTLSAQGSDLARCTALVKSSDGTIIDNYATSWQNLPLTFTATQDGYLFFTLRANNTQQVLDPTAYTTVQVESGSSVTEWMPYANICPITSFTSVNITQSGSTTNTYEVELTGAGNVYKGTLDVTSGELVVEWVKITLDGTQPLALVNWRADGTAVGWAYPYTMTNNKIPRNIDYGAIVSSSVPTETYAHLYSNAEKNGCAFYISSEYGLFVKTSRTELTTREMVNTYLTNNPIDIAYELATPQTYTLTPTQLSNLIGQNTIQADAGAVTVTYRTDARTEYKVYPYQYSYTYGDTAQNVFDIDCDLPSYFKLTIFGERTNPSWRVVQNGNIVKSGKLNATIGSSQKLVINTDPKNTEIALYTLSNTRINNLYGYSDFATERIFALPQGQSQLQVLTEDEQSPKVMIEVLKHV